MRAIGAIIATPPVTFLFTDIEGSTRLWESEPARMADALARHDELCHVAVEAHGGRVVKMIGDGLYAAFDDPAAAVAATLDLQRGMAEIASSCGIPFRMRCGLHAGVAQQRDGDYFGTAVNRAARIMAAAHGGQILLSTPVVHLARGRLPMGTEVLHLGRVRLRDLSLPEDVWQLLHPELQRAFPALRSLDATPNNLPQQATSFIGRENEMAEIGRLLGTTRLLTLTGCGGCGKTRLAIHVAANLLDRYPDGVWLVDLARLANPALVPQAMATVLGLKAEPGRSLMQTITAHLKSRNLLVVLDNAEHLVAAAAQLVDAILHQCRQVHVLVTSRQPLRIGGEHIYPVPSLSMPDPVRDTTAESLASYESVHLFVERARCVQPQFAVSDRNAAALASICHRLDGIPLALELAAARVQSLSPAELNERLDHRFLLLTGGSRIALPRQQTLRALMDWSYDLLEAPEQALLCRLTVFAGGWTLDAAAQVCTEDGADDAQALDLLTSLTDKSLVVAEERNGATRYRLLETIREYARERLRDTADGVRCRERHLAYFLALAEAAEPELRLAQQQAWIDRLETEHDNLLAALTWSSGAGNRAPEALRLAGALSRFWYVHDYLDEGRRWLSSVLAVDPDRQLAPARAKALFGSGALAWLQGDHRDAELQHERGLSIFRALGDRRGIAASLNSLGLLARDQDRHEQARQRLQESAAIFEELGDRRGIQMVIGNLGLLLKDEGEYPAARELLEKALAIARESGNRHAIAVGSINLGNVASDQGDVLAAQAHYEEGLALARELGDRLIVAAVYNNLGDLSIARRDYPRATAMHRQGLAIRRELGARQGIADSFNGLAEIAFGEGRFARAALLWGAVARLRADIGVPVLPGRRALYDRQAMAARAALGARSFEAAWQQGRALTLEQALDYALAASDSPPTR